MCDGIGPDVLQPIYVWRGLALTQKSERLTQGGERGIRSHRLRGHLFAEFVALFIKHQRQMRIGRLRIAQQPL
jgi:hypothetical protein